MEFKKHHLLSYETSLGPKQEAALLEATLNALSKLNLPPEQKEEIQTLAGKQGETFKIFILIPFEDEAALRAALAVVWDPPLLNETRVVDITLVPPSDIKATNA